MFINTTDRVTVAFLTALLGIATARLHAADPVAIANGSNTLAFSADGKPKSWVIEGKELLNQQNPGPGFEVKGFAYNYQQPTSFRLQNLTLKDRMLTATAGEDTRITWETSVSDRYVAFRLVRVEGLPKANRLTLTFSMNLTAPAKVVSLGAMTTVGATGCSASWPWLWQRTTGGDMGGFALLVPGKDEVAGFKTVWQDLGLTRPTGAGPWNVETCERWFSTQRLGFAPAVAVQADPSANAAPAARIGSAALGLQFAGDGKPIALTAGERNLLPAKDPGAGFTLQRFDPLTGKVVALPSRSLRWADGRLTVEMGNGARAVFHVTASDRYLAFRLTSVDGFSSPDLEWLQFRLNVQGTYRLTALDYMTEVNPNVCTVTWPWLWKRRPGAPLGGFALSLPKDDADADETLLHLWVEAGLPHPRVKGDWDLATARAWLAEWQRQFADQSQMLITAKSNDDLYRLADAAAGMGLRRIYMHTDTWNGEYWPIKYSFIHLNPQVFPGGEPDFQRFAAYAKDKGIGLTIHTVSASIANADPDYVVGTIDPRLATWIRGTLDAPVDPKDRTLRFRPAPGGEMPLHLDRPVTGPAHVDPWNNIKTVRLGDEFVRVGRFTDTDREVWTLTDCTRGAYKTAAVDHAPATAMAGMIRPYDQVFTADNDTNLVEELGRRTAEFNNRNNVIHCEQDAGEVHTVNHPWGYDRFAEAVYTNLDHPVTSNNSGGSHMPCQLEYQFSSSKAITVQHHQPQVPLTIAREGRPATSPYEMPSLVAKAVAKGVTSIGLYKPEPMFGVSTEILREHGLADLAMQTVVAWRQVATRLTTEQRQAILGRDDHVIHRAEKSATGYQVTPMRLLTRPGIDIGWHPGSEFGPVVPRQYVAAGAELQVENPWAAQEPEFILRVMPAFGEGRDARPRPDQSPTKGPATGPGAQEEDALERYLVGAGVGAAAHPFQGGAHVWAADGLEAGQAKPGKCWLRKTFTWNRSPGDRVDLICQADDRATLWVNGRSIGTSGDDWSTASVTDITPHLREGGNLLAIEADNADGPGCVTAAIVLSGAAGVTTITTDATWKSSVVKKKGWKDPEFDDQDWKPAGVVKPFGDGPWGRAKLVASQGPKTLLQPKAAAVGNRRDHRIDDDGDALRIRFDNPRNEAILLKEQGGLPSFACTGDMSGARGIGLTVVGDGSGAILVLRAHCRGFRDYIVPVDFTGPRDIVIPCGEVSWADARWGWSMDSKGAQYGTLVRMDIGFGRIPPRTSPDVRVSRLRVLPEVAVTTVDPVVHLGRGSLRIHGSVASESYLWYRGGPTIGVYDLNWKRLTDLPVDRQEFIAPQGPLTIRVDCPGTKAVPWLEAQFLVKDTPLDISP